MSTNHSAFRWLTRTLVAAAAAAVMTACSSEAPTSPITRKAGGQILDTTSNGSALSLSTAREHELRGPDLGTCDSLRAPAYSKMVAHLYAEGVQIYQWNGASWAFIAPQATLSASPDGRGVIGTHFAGPTWKTLSGSSVVAAVAKRCPSPANAIPWLLLRAVSTEGPGLFHRVSFIQRVNTVGGNAPAENGTTVGQLANVPYTAEYYFYR